ncbi:Phage holin family Hol44, holin superfamily V [Desulfonispora thiosulfatigenes DSM 11270]|uniref:Phage holin family Hol44, holin superfamily V n=2 Tax=Desulfonispora thiosulfatigenes TaxID=83661 RepID=A0A1W1VPZ3_DESTI|nr:Phage holin family Hol44, holin superfamily V [Desulfonispora thiosulfatigenes DSM 11270]
MNYIIKEAYILIPALWIVGTFLKRTPKVQDWTIVWVVIILGITGAVGMLGFSVNSVAQGIIIAGISVLGHQVVKQTNNRE